MQLCFCCTCLTQHNNNTKQILNSASGHRRKPPSASVKFLHLGVARRILGCVLKPEPAWLQPLQVTGCPSVCVRVVRRAAFIIHVHRIVVSFLYNLITVPPCRVIRTRKEWGAEGWVGGMSDQMSPTYDRDYHQGCAGCFFLNIGF